MRAETYDALGDYGHEIADYTEAIRLYPNYGLFYKSRGLAYGALRQYEKEIADLTKAIGGLFVDPKELYYNRGLTYATLRRYESAIRDYTQVIKEWSPGMYDQIYLKAYESRGKAYEAIGNKKAANADLEKVRQLGAPKN
jgi:tetratricopeptide (TPR) repeat protein